MCTACGVVPSRVMSCALRMLLLFCCKWCNSSSFLRSRIHTFKIIPLSVFPHAHGYFDVCECVCVCVCVCAGLLGVDNAIWPSRAPLFTISACFSPLNLVRTQTISHSLSRALSRDFPRTFSRLAVLGVHCNSLHRMYAHIHTHGVHTFPHLLPPSDPRRRVLLHIGMSVAHRIE